MTKTTVWRLALAVAVLGLFTLQLQQVGLLARIVEVMADVPKNSLVTEWKSASHPDGKVRVVTTKNIGESDAALLVRHTNEVAAQLELYPISS